MTGLPPITIDPTDVVTWEDAVRLWVFALRVHIISKAEYNPTTDPASYKALLDQVNAWLQQTTGGALTWGESVLPQVAQNTDLLMAVQATDPTNVSTISGQPITDLVTTGGSIGTIVSTVGNGSYGLVQKAIAIISVISILGATLFVSQLTPADKEEINESVDDFADENDNVVCYYDEEGKSYLPSGFIEKIRQTLIRMGAFDKGNVEEFDESVIPNTVIDLPLKTFGSGVYRFQAGIRHYAWNLTGDIRGGLIKDRDSNLCRTLIASTTNTSAIGSVYADYSDPGVPEAAPHPDYWTSATYDGKTVYYCWDNSWTNMVDFGDFEPYITTMDYRSAWDPGKIAWNMIYNTTGGVPGIEMQPDAVIPANPNISLEDYMPDWYDNKKTFKAVEYGEDRDIQGLTDIDFLPATFKDVQGFEADSTQTQAQAQDGTAPNDSDVVNALLPAIQEFYEKLINNPDTPNPTIPISDSGDTPPAEPPLISGSSNGLWAIYNPTLSEVQQFGAWLWSSNILDQITRMFSSPIDAVIGFHMIYCTPITGASKIIKAGYLDSPVSAKEVTNQYATIDCGTIDVPEYYGTVLDYKHTKLMLYLPFIGIVPLQTEVCMGAQLQVIYRIDVLTGTCLAQVKVIKTDSDAVMYTFPGNCAVQIPLTATTYTGTVGALIGIANTAISVALDNPYGAVNGAKQALEGVVESVGTGGIKQSGGLGSNAGALGIRIPYLIITHPVAYNAVAFNTQYGYPVNETVVLGSINGYTRVKDIHLHGIPCTDDELEMIERLLKDGVIIN